MQKIYILIFVLTLFLVGCDSEGSTTNPPIAFEQLKSIDGLGRASGTSFVIADTAYITLGRRGEIFLDCFDTPGSSLQGEPPEDQGTLPIECWAYDAENDLWTSKAPFPGEGRVYPVSGVIEGIAYVGLGYNYGCAYNDSAYLQDFWAYDPVVNSWSRKADFPTRGSNHAVSFVYQDELYVVHAFGVISFNKAVWKYSPVSNQWIQLTDFPGYVRTSAVGCTDGNRVFAGTGYATWNENDWWEYLPAADRWERKKDMPDKGRINAQAFAFDNRFFVATGRYLAGMHVGGELKADLLEYLPERNRWKHRATLPGGARENAVSFILKGKIYIGFGENEQGPLDDLWSFEL